MLLAYVHRATWPLEQQCLEIEKDKGAKQIRPEVGMFSRQDAHSCQVVIWQAAGEIVTEEYIDPGSRLGKSQFLVSDIALEADRQQRGYQAVVESHALFLFRDFLHERDGLPILLQGEDVMSLDLVALFRDDPMARFPLLRCLQTLVQRPNGHNSVPGPALTIACLQDEAVPELGLVVTCQLGSCSGLEESEVTMFLGARSARQWLTCQSTTTAHHPPMGLPAHRACREDHPRSSFGILSQGYEIFTRPICLLTSLTHRLALVAFHTANPTFQSDDEETGRGCELLTCLGRVSATSNPHQIDLHVTQPVLVLGFPARRLARGSGLLVFGLARARAELELIFSDPHAIVTDTSCTHFNQSVRGLPGQGPAGA